MDIVRFGLIGCGGIGEMRAKAAHQYTGSRLVAVVDMDRNRADALAGTFQAARENDWRSLIRRDDIDAIILSTPPSSHSEIAIAAMQAGKHVLCEKPLAKTAEECRQMILAAETTRRVLATGFNFRFFCSVEKAKELLDSGAIGELDHIRSYGGYNAFTVQGPNWLHDADTVGGGAMRDNGIHLIDTTCYFLGDPVAVQGYSSSRVMKLKGCEDNGFVLLRNANGNIATLQASWTEWRGYRFAIEIFGSKGCLSLRCFPMTMELVVGQRDSQSRMLRSTYYFPKVNLMERVKSYRWVIVDSFLKEYDHFRRAINGQPTSIASGGDGLRAITIADSACGPADGQPSEHAISALSQAPASQKYKAVQ